MKTIVLVLALVAAAFAAPLETMEELEMPIFYDYHREIGIPEAARIKASEEAADFDGARITGGSSASLGQYPFMGGLVVHLTIGGNPSVCGSSLLTNTRLVTAAHCWRHRVQARQFTVVLGSIRLFTGGVRINTNQVEMHAQYNQNNLHNDVAMIRISSVGFNNNIRSIGLASGTNAFVGTQANAVGFGRKGDNVGIPQTQTLSHVRLPVITNAECQRVYGGGVIASTLCTSGANRRSTCPGDSGGPLAVGNTLIGITSFGHRDGCQRNFPAGFARVTSFNAWIRARM